MSASVLTPTPTPAPAAVALEGIAKKFGGYVALRDISLSVGSGEFICFLGPSGCGKTTLLRIIAGLERQNAGTVLMSGRDVSALPPAQRNYGIVFQSYALFPNLTVGRNVAYGLETRSVNAGAIASRVDELLALVGLARHKDKYPAQLSGGEQQRVALARALAPSPALLLLDEPLSALDARVRQSLRHEIRGLQRRLGVTTIMVTHDQEEALSMADRVVVMNHGVIEQIGTPLEVYVHPATPFVADFLGKVNVLEAECLGAGRYRVGKVEIATPANGAAPGERVRLYLRPEDRILADTGAVETMPNALKGMVRRIDFLGTYCLARVDVDGFEGQAMTIYLSLNQANELGVREGAAIPFALRGERVRVFRR